MDETQAMVLIDQEEEEIATPCDNKIGRAGVLTAVSFSLLSAREAIKKDLEEVEENKDCSAGTIDNVITTLLLGDKLYDRSDEKARLLDRFDAIVNNENVQSELVVITGASGTGKTSLALTLREPVQDRGGFLISGKFDQLRQTGSYPTFVDAFSDFTRQFLDRNRNNSNRSNNGTDAVASRLDQLRKKVVDATGGEAKLLTQMIPELYEILGDQPEHSSALGADAQRRFRHVFCKFVASVCSVETPLVLFLDDLQWSDKESLDLLAALLVDSSVEGLMIVGACRGDEVSIDDDLSVMLRSMESDSVLSITDIQVKNLCPDAVASLVSDFFCLPLAQCQPLAQFVYSETQGNPLFTIHLLKSMVESGAVIPSNDTQELFWDAAMIGSLHVEHSDDLVHLICDRIGRLPPSAQELLKVAACMGAEFETGILDAATAAGSSGDRALVESLGYIVPVGGRQPFALQYRFAHDKIQQASYGLIHEGERPAFHVVLARRLWESLSRSNMLFQHASLVVNQFREGLHLLEDDTDRLAVAQLCLRAGKSAENSSSFRAAAQFFATGQSLLPRRHWRDCYQLSLELLNSAVEVEYAVANFDRTDNLVEDILCNALTLDDKLPAYTTRIYSLGSRGQLQEALDVGRSVLAMLKEPLPRDPTRLHIFLAFRKTSQMLRGWMSESILELPMMEDKNKLAAMRILSIMYAYASTTQPMTAALTSMRLVQLSLKHGISAISATGFSFFAMMFASLNRIDKASRYGKLAVLMVDKFSVRHWIPRVYACVYGVIKPVKIPLRECIEPLQYAHRVGMGSGDVEFAMVNLYLSCYWRLFASEQLSGLHKDLKEIHRLMSSYRQDYILSFHVLTAQLVSNLLGLSQDVLVLTGQYMDELNAVARAKEQNNAVLLLSLYAFKGMLCYIMNDNEGAAQAVEQFRRCNISAGPRYFYWYIAFLSGVSNLYLARKQPSFLGRWQRVREAKQCLKKLKIYARNCPTSFLHRLYFVEAEFSLWTGDLDRALDKYELALKTAVRQGWIHEAALITEHKGLALCENGRMSEGVTRLRDAMLLYRDWGAEVKVRQLEAMIASSSAAHPPTSFSSADKPHDPTV